MKKLALFASLFSMVYTYGQDFHRCYTHEAMLETEVKYPGYINGVNELFERAKNYESQNREDVYTIPVVVHIVYNTIEENLPDSVVYNQIESLNADYRRLNADAADTRDAFATIVGDTFIGFELASVDPEGNPTTGITRTETDEDSFLTFGALQPAEGVKSTLNGGIDPWDQSRYLNIWVCDMSLFGTVFLLGYATPPNGLDHWPDGAVDGLGDGVVIQYEAFGSNNPNPLDIGGDFLDVRGRTATHEVGHYLGLRHIWGDGDCAEQDGVDDTPNAEAQSDQDCDFTKNTCVDDIADLGDLPDMVENYMDYSAETCQNAFTKGQVDLMRGILEIERFDLVNDNPALGIKKQENNAGFSIYPNPSEGSFSIDLAGYEDVIISVYSETGQLVQNYTQQKGFASVEITGLESGFYMLQLKTKENAFLEKVIVY